MGGWLKEPQLVFAKLAGDDVVPREFPGQIDVGIHGVRRRTHREAAEADHLRLVMAGDMPAGTCDGQCIEQFQEIAAEDVDEVLFLALRRRLFCPGGETSLGVAGRGFQAPDAKVVRKSFVGLLVAGHVATGNEGDLVPQICQLVVDRRGREQEHLRADAGLDDVVG